MNKNLIHKFRPIYQPLIYHYYEAKNKTLDFLDLAVPFNYESHLTQLSIQHEDRICILAPHVDDEILGIGGIIHKFIINRNKILIVYTSDGRKSICPGMTEEDMVAARNEEARNWSKDYRNISINLCNYQSMEWNPYEKASELLDVIRKFEPNLVFFPGICDKNIDHVKNALCLSIVANRLNLETKYYMYPVQTPIFDKMISNYQALTNEDLAFKNKILNSFHSQHMMARSFDKVLLSNKILAKNYNAYAIEILCHLKNEQVTKFHVLNEDYYCKNFPTITYCKSIAKAIKMNNKLQAEIFYQLGDASI